MNNESAPLLNLNYKIIFSIDVFIYSIHVIEECIYINRLIILCAIEQN